MRRHTLPDISEAAHALERRFGVGGLKRGMLAMLAGWIAYFFIINMFVRSLNKVTVPLLDMPLGVFLAIQGMVVIFVVALCVLAKWHAQTHATVRIRRDRRH